MIIGFTRKAGSANDESEIDVLRRADCERIYSPAQGVFSFEQFVDYLRADDIAVIADLSQVGDNLNDIVLSISRLHSIGATLHVADTDIRPGTPLGNSFTGACSILARYSMSSRAHSTPVNGRRRGRPRALENTTIDRAERLLKSGRMSVHEIAHVLGVSPATIYRYFPREARIDSSPARRPRLIF